jgi:hypothetical protein
MAVEIFFSYAREDEALMDQIRHQLVLFEREGIIVKWYDRKIQAGEEWGQKISWQLSVAKIILLLFSPDFLASRYCYSVEMAEALKRHEKGEAVVIPIILRHCLWQETPIGKLQALPKDGKPITKWSNRDEATMDVAAGIIKVVRELNLS